MGNDQTFHSSFAADLFSYGALLLTLAGCMAVLRNFWQREWSALVPVTVLATLLFAHTISHADLMYYYQRFPFLFLFVGVAASQLQEKTARILNHSVLAWSLWLCVLVLTA